MFLCHSRRVGPLARRLDRGRGFVRWRYLTASLVSIAATKRKLLTGGLLQPVEWGVPTGERDERGRTMYAWADLDALIEDRPALDRSTIDTDRADNTVLTILDPVAITDEHLFRWGDPPHTYSSQSGRRDCAG